MPLDALPTENGTFAVVEGIAIHKSKLDPARDDGERFTPHHATCPKVERFRR